MSAPDPIAYFQPHLARMAGYVPGEQPRDGVYIKLNTNENPYPPSPRVAEAIAGAVDRLRLYPDPIAAEFCRAAAELHGMAPETILAGNGSDDLLTIVTRAFVAPGAQVVYPTPSYILYRTLTELQNAVPVEVEFRADWLLDIDAFAKAAAQARLAFVANPNSPSGTLIAPDVLSQLAIQLPCPLVIDEAYVDFADSHCIGLAARHPNVIVLRTLSKGYGLAGLRMGYLIANPALVAQLVKVKDSYNCDRLSIAGGAAALRDQAYLAQTRARIRSTRERLRNALIALGYDVPPSQANFVWCQGGPPAEGVYQALRDRMILVRLMRYAGRPPGLRITVGTDAEIDALLTALREVMG